MISYRYDHPERESYREAGWKYLVKAYYNEKVPEHRKGKVAFITKHRTQFSKDTEVKAASDRKDIGTIEVFAFTGE